MGRIVVGVDGSEDSIRALRWAIEESRFRSDTVEAVIAWTYPYAAADGFGTIAVGIDPSDLIAGANRTLDTALLAACPEPEARAAIERRVEEDRPSHALVEASKGADLLVVGSLGHGAFAELLLGSVSLHCVTHANCPVVVVRPTK